ncbi:unnamed protein product [Leptosia nina]|uniref:DDE-1 domain-containing protein n=1 Tax=Leptosia nina TaxID=320188 RepID=A0AAV1JYB8_9NEOP
MKKRRSLSLRTSEATDETVQKTQKIVAVTGEKQVGNMAGAVSDSGWTNESLFVDWLHHFISYAKPSNPVLLIFDNQERHISPDFTVFLTFAHASHRLQPLDLTYFGLIKTAYNRECEKHMADRL